MKAHVQILSGVVRVGEHYEKWLDEYDFAVAFSSVDNETAIGMGLVNPFGEAKPVTRAHILAAVKQVKEDTGLDLIYERSKNMAKKNIPHVDAATTDEDHKAAIAIAAQQHAEGHIGFKDWAQEDLGNGEVRISVTRYETNPGQPAEA